MNARTEPLSPLRSLDPSDFHDEVLAALDGKVELAVLDVRERGAFARKHILYAASLPEARVELDIATLVPNPATRILLTDLDGQQVDRVGERLKAIGYGNVAVLLGGTLAWEAEGLEVFSGEYVPSKALGEVAEHVLGTPSETVEGLHKSLSTDAPLLLIDTRTPDEFRRFSLPGAHNIPNGELAYRVPALLRGDTTTPIVLNCAGRTRSIVGAQTLRDAGLPNPVAALQDGTMAWLLSGRTLDTGRHSPLPIPLDRELAHTRERLATHAGRLGVERIDTARLQQWQSDTARTTYLLDTRSLEEYQQSHLEGWRWAPGGQLVQAADSYIPVIGATVVLADHDGVRAYSTAIWLQRLGWHHVFVYPVPLDKPLRWSSGEPTTTLLLPAGHVPAPQVTAAQLAASIERGDVVIVDVDNSWHYHRGHIPGAYFSAPSLLGGLLGQLPGGPIVLTSADGRLAAHVAALLQREGVRATSLRGGNAAWRLEGRAIESGSARNLTGEEDLRYTGYYYDDLQKRDQKFHEYLDWERQLPAQLEKPGSRSGFRVTPTA